MRVNFIVNVHRSEATSAARELVAWLHELGVTVGADRESFALVGAHRTEPDDFANAELVVTMGGDGTLIKAAGWCSRLGTPILGVNFGRFGFVTQCPPKEAKCMIQGFLDGTGVIEERMMIRTDLVRNGQGVATLHALNESVIHRTPTSGMVVVNVAVDGVGLTSYPADGVLVATATGSTAYNLSAGGPLVDPSLRGILLTAIAPHTLSARPLIVSEASRIQFRIEPQGDAVLSADGQHQLHLLTDDLVEVSVSDRTTRLVRAGYNDFLMKLSAKLLWSHRPSGGQTES